MGLYDIVYSWFETYIWTTSAALPSYSIGGVTLTQNQWLCHTSTIVVMVLLCVVAGLLIKWIFGLFSRLWGR